MIGKRVVTLSTVTLAVLSVLLLIAVHPVHAQTFTTLYSFCSQARDGICVDGTAPVASLVQATNGDLYGVTAADGPTQTSEGTIFKITPTGVLTTLYSFGNQAGGASPSQGLVQATNADLYGTTWSGGASSGSSNDGYGTIFKITQSGALTTLYSFTNGADGERPGTGLVQATNGDLYGTTSANGPADNGTIFKMTASGALTTLYTFCLQNGCPDGVGPSGALIQGTDGNLYGMTEIGGALDIRGTSPAGAGTVFKITPSGTLTTLYSFTGNTDGGCPMGGLIQATDGNFYGTTLQGGANAGSNGNGAGTIFKITPSGTLTTLYSFCSQSGCTDGEEPLAGLVQATDGNFYGTTYYGRGNAGVWGDSAGTIFKITPGGALTTLYSFCPQSG